MACGVRWLYLMLMRMTVVEEKVPREEKWEGDVNTICSEVLTVHNLNDTLHQDLGASPLHS